SLDYSVMRTSLLGGLLGSTATNFAKKNRDFALFEIGRVFVAPDNYTDLPTELDHLAYITTQIDADFFSTKSILERIALSYNITFNYRQSILPYLHPNICADVLFGNKTIGHIGKVHPKVLQNYDISADAYYFEIDLGMIPTKKVKKIKQLSKFPSATRDLAVLADLSIPVGDMVNTISRSGGQLLQNVDVFDVYSGAEIPEGQKNVAFKLTFQKMDATLLADEINTAFDKILNDLTTKFNVKLR
ncbi:MAG: phenylalanine--tRNA ligase subunit beta, partial [Clostridia bacterium]|nr:phenylalanine--tRNA ligase subunit beta [Clostridia bacterium]